MKRRDKFISKLIVLVFVVIPLMSLAINHLIKKSMDREMYDLVDDISNNNITSLVLEGSKVSKGMLYVQKAFGSANVIDLKVTPATTTIYGDTLHVTFDDDSDVYQGSIMLNQLKVVSRNGTESPVVDMEELLSRTPLRVGAIDTTEYKKEVVNKRVEEYDVDYNSMKTPLHTFLIVKNLFADGKLSDYHNYTASHIKQNVKSARDRELDEENKKALLTSEILSILTYGNLAAVAVKQGDDYQLSYYYNEDGTWGCVGEDAGMNSPIDTEIVFRNKAKQFLLNIQKRRDQDLGSSNILKIVDL